METNLEKSRFHGARLRVLTFPLFAGAFALVACKGGASAEHRSTSPAPTQTSSAATQASSIMRVEVSEHGFQPSNLVLDQTRTIVFRRTSNATCATAVVFPTLGIEKPLPLNTDVTVELPPSAKGEVGFQCGMGMYKGKVVVQ